MKNIVILGAGTTGLRAAWTLQRSGLYKVILVEKEGEAGGQARTIRVGDGRADFGPHRFQTQDPEILCMAREASRSKLLTVTKKNIKILFRNSFINYPFQPLNLLTKIPVGLSLIWGLGFLKGKTEFLLKGIGKNYEEFLKRQQGIRAYRMVAKPYTMKFWGSSPAELSVNLGLDRVVLLGIKDFIKKVIHPDHYKDEAYQNVFYYPPYGIGEICSGMAEQFIEAGGSLVLKASPEFIRVEAGHIKSLVLKREEGLQELESDMVISTIPLTELVELISHSLERPIIEQSRSLRFRELALVYIVLDHPALSHNHMIYFPEAVFPFHRIYEITNFSPYMAPKGQTIICIEYPFSPEKDCLYGMIEEYIGVTIDRLKKLKLISRKVNVMATKVVRLAYAYPIYKSGYEKNVESVMNALSRFDNLYINGRQGLFKLNNMDHALAMGESNARFILEGRPHMEWMNVCERFKKFRIID